MLTVLPETSAPEDVRTAAALSTARSLRAALDNDDMGVRVLLPDRRGTLTVVHAVGPPSTATVPLLPRAHVFETHEPVDLILPPPGGSLLIHPMEADGDTVGVVEIEGPAREIDDRRGILATVLEQGARAIRYAQDGATAEALLALSSELLKAQEPAKAVRAAVRFCVGHVDGPVLGVLLDRRHRRWRIAALSGVSRRRLEGLTKLVEAAPEGGRARLIRALHIACSAAFGEDPEVVAAGDAVLVAGVRDEGGRRIVRETAQRLGHALARFRESRSARDRKSHPDLALAWAVHELRTPLLGARAALEHVLTSDDRFSHERLLVGARDELERLASFVDPLLRLVTAGGPLARRSVLLREVVEQAIASAELGGSRGRVTLDAPDHLIVSADAPHLVTAVANVVRNALAYSPGSSRVRVSIVAKRRMAKIHVRDAGPGIQGAEEELVFRPFVRGTQGRLAPTGTGLGLAIAKRVAEAHGGDLRLCPSTEGACFELTIPMGRSRRSES